jgi:6-phosphogluconolactonase (cycloisomerase 2 family)
MSYNILGSGYRPNITLFSFDSTSAKIHKVSDSKAPENASWLEPGKEGVIYSTSEVPNGEVYSLKLQGEDLEITGKRSTKGEEPAHGMLCHDVIRWDDRVCFPLWAH